MPVTYYPAFSSGETYRSAGPIPFHARYSINTYHVGAVQEGPRENGMRSSHQHALVRAAMDSMALAIVVIDQGWRVVAASPAFTALVEQPESALINKAIASINDGVFAPILLAPADMPWSLPLQLPDGRTMLTSTRPVEEHQAHVGWVVTLQSVTARRAQAQQQPYSTLLVDTLRQNLDRLQHMLIASNEVAADLSAQFRHQLQHMITDLQQREQRIELLRNVEQATTSHTPTALAPLIHQVLEEHAARALTGMVALTSDLEQITACVVPQQIAVALRELLANAFANTPAGGAIEVRLFAHEGHLALQVRDTGNGISVEHHTQIFEPFYQAESPRAQPHGGVGLGLTIVRAVAHNHGGSVQVESIPGQCSCFTMLLPQEKPVVPAYKPTRPESVPVVQIAQPTVILDDFMQFE